MNVEQILRVVREDFLDDDVTPYRWGASKLLRWLNQAQMEACRRQRLLVEEDDPTLTQVTLVDGTGSYTLDPRTHIVDRVVYNRNTIPKATKHQLDRIMPAWREMEPGEPMLYLQNDLTIRLLPTPGPSEDSQILTLRVWRLPLADLVLDTDVPEIPLSHHEELAYYVAARAYMQPDEDTVNTGLADRYMAEFDKMFGPPMSADVLAHKRRETNVSWVGPSHAYHGRRYTEVRGRNQWDYED
jgi:hypothetical protein